MYYHWLVRSSSNPEKYSMTILSAILGVVPTIMIVLDATCGLQIFCVPITEDELADFGRQFSQFVFLILSAVSLIGTMWGGLRKIWNGRWSAPVQ